MILIDAGPLVALADSRDKDHRRCTETTELLTDTQLITTWPCLTEAMYLLGREGGLNYQIPLWELIQSELLEIYNLNKIDR